MAYIPFGISITKPVFILETEFKIGKDMVDEGLAKSLKFDEIDKIHEKVRSYKTKKINPNFYFNNISLKDILKPIFLR